MKQFAYGLLLATLFNLPAAAEEGPRAGWDTLPAAPSEDMWFYLQETRRNDDPQQAVRRNAEYRAAQRRTRIATMKWLGYSKLRPNVSVTPSTGVYAPTWFRVVPAPVALHGWVGGGTPTPVTDAKTARSR